MQGEREPTRHGGKRQTWTRCGLQEPGGVQREVELPPRQKRPPPKKNDTAVISVAREGRRGDTKRRWRPRDKDLDRSRNKRRARTGHNRRSVSRPAAKSAKDCTKKERGKEHVWVQQPKRLRLGDQLRDVSKAGNPSHKGDNGR